MGRATLFVGLAFCVCTSSASASQQDIRRAYDAAVRCYVANGHVYSVFKRAGDTANTRLFEAKVKQSFDVAYFYGDMLHLGQQQVTDDLNTATNAELPRLVQDSGYLTTVAKECKREGLM